MTDWPGYMARGKELLRSGGWLEVQDVDFILRTVDGYPLTLDESWYHKERAAFLQKGVDLEMAMTSV